MVRDEFQQFSFRTWHIGTDGDIIKLLLGRGDKRNKASHEYSVGGCTYPTRPFKKGLSIQVKLFF